MDKKIQKIILNNQNIIMQALIIGETDHDKRQMLHKAIIETTKTLTKLNERKTKQDGRNEKHG